MPLLNKSGLNPGTSFGVDEAGDVANLRLELEGLKIGADENRAPSGIISPSPAATFWVTYRAVKNGVIVTLRHAIDPNTVELHIVLEEYVVNGGIVTVLGRTHDTIEITPDMLSVVSGVTVVEREFGKKLDANTTYGLLRYAATLSGSKRAIYAPAADPPAQSSRVLGDYITTFNSTNGQAVVPQGSSPLNLIYDGSFEYADDSSANNLRWWDTRDGGWASGFINTTNTNDVWWDQANNCAVWQSQLKALTISVGRRLHRSEKISVNFDLWASGSFAAIMTLEVSLQATPTSEVVQSFIGTFNVSTSIQRVNIVLQMLSNYTTSAKHRLRFGVLSELNNNGGAGTGRSIRIGYVMVTRGIEPAPFQYRIDSFETGRVVGTTPPSEDPDVTVTRVIPGNDYGSGVNIPGGGSNYIPV